MSLTPCLSSSNTATPRLMSARAAIEQAHAQRVFQLGNRSRQRGLGRPEAFGRLAHAARLNHRHEDAHVVQFQAALDAVGLVHGIL